MKKIYNVTIRAIVTKTYRCKASNREIAEESAHELFSVLNEPDVDEHYEQKIMSVEEVFEGEKNDK